MIYGLKEYKALLEKNLEDLKDPNSVPFGVDPNGYEGIMYRKNKMESINYAIEMLPEIKEPMKDHEFRDEVHTLRDIAIDFAGTGQLRSRLSMFLKSFKDKVES